MGRTARGNRLPPRTRGREGKSGIIPNLTAALQPNGMQRNGPAPDLGARNFAQGVSPTPARVSLGLPKIEGTPCAASRARDAGARTPGCNIACPCASAGTRRRSRCRCAARAGVWPGSGGERAGDSCAASSDQNRTCALGDASRTPRRKRYRPAAAWGPADKSHHGNTPCRMSRCKTAAGGRAPPARAEDRRTMRTTRPARSQAAALKARHHARAHLMEQ